MKLTPQRLALISGSLMIVAAIGLAYPSVMDFIHTRQVPHLATSPFTAKASAQEVVKPAEYISGKPVRIEIPSLEIDLTVVDGHFNETTKQWTLTNDKAQYAVKTPEANNESGNTFIYGHNRPGVFKTLNRIKVGETAIVTTENGHRFTYKFRGAIETNPNDDSLFRYRGPAILTVQTCSGMWFQNRQLFTFDLEGVV